MEYSNTPNMSGGQQIYVSQSQDPPRVSGCNPQHIVNTFPGVDCNSSNRNYGSYSQAYQTHEYSGPHTSHIAGPPGVYQQPYSSEAHGQSLTLNQLLQQNSSTGTYPVRAMNNSQPIYRSYDPYPYTYKPGAPSCMAHERTQANSYSYSGAQRFADPYARPYFPYPPGPNYPYYPHSQPLVQRARAPQPPNLEYPTMNSCNQSRPLQPAPPGGGTPNQIERPPSRNINYINSSSHTAFQNTQVSSPVYTSGSQISSWSAHTATFGSPQQVQSQPRPRSLSRDYQLKINEGSSESPNTSNNNPTRPDSQNENISNTFEDSGCRPQSRLSESGIPSTPKSVTSCAKDQLDGQNTASSVEVVAQNAGIDGTPQPQASTPSSSIANLSVSPLSAVSRETSPTQSYPSFVQSSVPSSSPMISSQMGNIQVQQAACPSPGQSKGSHQSNQTAVPSPRPYGMGNQELGVPRMTYPPYPHPQQASLPNSPYSAASGRSPGFSPAGYPLRSPSVHPSNCIPNRPQFQPSSGPPTSTGSMPPPPTLPPSSSLSSNQSSVCDNNGPSQSTFTQIPSYSTPFSSAGGGYPIASSQPHGSHPSWDQEVPYQPPLAQSQPHPGNMFHHHFGGRSPYPGSSAAVDRGVGYPSIPNPSVSSSLMPLNGQHLQPSATTGSPYSHNLQPMSYPNHHAQYPYSQSQMPYHPQSQYPHPYSAHGPNGGGGGPPVLQQQQPSQPQHSQHMVAQPASSIASPYSSSMLSNNASSLPQHIQNSREVFHMQHYPHDLKHPPVSSSNESFASSGFPPNGGSPGIVRPSVMTNNINNNNNNAISKSNLVTGKIGKVDPMTRPVNSNFPTSISLSSQMSVNQAVMLPGGELNNSLHVQQQYQHRLGPQSNHPQLQQQYPGVGNYPPGVAPGPFGSQGGPINNVNASTGDVLQGSPSFQGYQQQYHSPSNSQISQQQQQSQNTTSSASNQSLLYSADGTHSDVGSVHQPLSNISGQSLTGFHKLMEMGSEPERRPWLEHYIRFMDSIGKPVAGLPQVVKQPLDLYRFYVAVRERGGIAEVIKARRWKEISQAIQISASASAGYALRKNYCKFLLEYECRFDRGGIDPRPLLVHIENLSGKKRKCSSVEGDLNSLSSGLAPPAPPSPTGSHSSASSSLLPPGSSGASLSGGPSGTAGSAASDSQLGPPSSQQQRFSDQGQPGSVSTVPESPNGMPNVPSPLGLSGQSSTSYLPSSGPTPSNVASPQRPPSCAVISGYPNTSLPTSDNNCCPWSWTSENSNSEPATYPHPTVPEPITTGHGVILSSRETTSTQYAQSRIAVPGNLPPNNNIPPTASAMHVSMPNSSSCASTPMMNAEPMTQHSFNPYLTIGPPPPFASNQSHPILNQHHGPPQTMEHSFPGSQSPIHPRHPGNHSFRTPSFNSINPPSAVSGESIALFRMHQLRPGASQIPPYILGGAAPPFCSSTNAVVASAAATTTNNNFNQTAPIPPHFIHHNQRQGYVTTIFKRLDHYAFPPGSVEATPVDSPRRRRYRAKDLGPIAPFKLLMALRSGLTAEVSWALNCLNILLRDENGFDLIVPSALPGLLTSLVDLWRHTLGELFDHNLFITTLELPTDLSIISSPSTKTTTDVKQNLMLKSTHHLHTNSTYLDIKTKAYLNDTSYNNLSRLECEIRRIAAGKNVPLSAVRSGLRRLLYKCNDTRSVHTPVRLRNGLMLRLENFSTVAVNPIISSCNSSSRLIDTNTNSASSVNCRSRKRSKHLSSTSIFSPTTVTITTTTSNFMSTSCNIPNDQQTYTSYNTNIPGNLVKPDNNGKVIWSNPQVTSIVDCLRSPEAYANLRDLALYVIDTFLESHQSNHYPSDEIIDIKINSQLNSLKSSTLTKSNKLQQLIEKGGGDTTCHIMPPFGAKAFQSSHWMNNSENNLLSFDEYLPNLTECSTVSSPLVVDLSLLKESISSNDLNDELIKMHESEDDEQLQSQQCKRRRHTSSSSLPCPTLSPQPVCDVNEDVTDSKLLELNDSGCKCIVPRDDVDELEFSQFIDENGRCPLRAREELVHHGSVCLWPNHNEVDSYEARAVRCLCVSTVLRNLSFMNTAERHLSKHKGILTLIGRLMLFGHEHVGENDTWQVVEEKAHALESSFCAWWTPTWLEDMRENAMVLLVNVAGYLELVHFDESIVRPILGGLLHWITCSTSASIDPFPGHRTLSPRRLALEALNRLCVHETNVDLLLSTPSDEKVLSKLFDRLATWLAVPEDQVTRELALSTMHYLAGGGASFSTSSVSSNIGKGGTNETNIFSGTYIGTTMLAVAKPCPISGLLAFIEAAEATTRRVIDQYGVQALQERPELMGTSLEMVRRAGALLDRLAIDSKGRSAFTPDLEVRLMDLVTSRVLDATVAHLLCCALHRLLLLPAPDCDHFEKDVKIATVPPIPTPSAVAELLTTQSAVVSEVVVTKPISQESTTTTTITSNQHVNKIEIFSKQQQQSTYSTTDDKQQSVNINNSNYCDAKHTDRHPLIDNDESNKQLVHSIHGNDDNAGDDNGSVDNKKLALNCMPSSSSSASSSSLDDKHFHIEENSSFILHESDDVRKMNGSVIDVNCNSKIETFDFRTNLLINDCNTTCSATTTIDTTHTTTVNTTIDNNGDVIEHNIYCNNTDSSQSKVNCVDSS
ncbi:Trithorax group protein [Schistosoma japonicum]|uniref:Trithorax group protein n=1 Tax=Schistosoma japonicum TaxID=6182 RepID=A0A4Z2D3D2_SCHJA|nr:Trithorax group protein [Schistosoma japonicum]